MTTTVLRRLLTRGIAKGLSKDGAFQIPRAFAHCSSMKIQTPTDGMLPTYPGTDNNLTCRLATPEDRNEIIEFMIKMFITREPLMKCINATAVDARPYVEYHVEVN